MRIVSRNRLGQRYRTIGNLSSVEAQALRSTWSRLFGVNDHVSVLATAGAAMDRVRQLDAWIACDCLGDSIENPPILYSREMSPGRFAIVRAPDRAHHDITCPFFWEEGALVGHAGGNRPGASSSRTPDFLLYRSRRAEASIASAPGGLDVDPRAAPMDSLARRMFYVIEQAGLHRMTEARTSIKEQFAALRSVISRMNLMPGVPLIDWFWTHPDWVLKDWATKRLCRPVDGWPVNIPPQGFLLFMADEISQEENCIKVNDHAIKIDGTFRVFAGASMEVRSPFLVLASLKLNPAGELMIPHAYAHPAMVSRLVPVDSNYERVAADALLWLARTAKDKYGVDVVIEKPVSDRCPDGDTPVRPDFEIHAGGRILVIETMGSDDPVYRARKQRMRALMQQIGPVYQDERVDVDPKEANSRLTRFVFGWLRASGILPSTLEGAAP